MRKVAVIGLGRVGLPAALVLAEAGNLVYGVDIDSSLVDALRNARYSTCEPEVTALLRRSVGRNFIPVTLSEFQNLHSKVDLEYIMVCIGVGISGGRVMLENLVNLVRRLASVGAVDSRTLILRTTVPLGTSDVITKTLESEFKLRESRDYFYSYMPERLAEGRAVAEERTLPKIVGVYSDEAFNSVSGLLATYSRGRVLKVKPPVKAELVKLIDNAWRNYIFAFANELAMLTDALGLDAHEIIDLANKDYSRNSIPKPGPVSGYCLSKDPLILEASYSQLLPVRYRVSLWSYARFLNDLVIEYISGKIVNAVNEALKHRERVRLLFLGLSYKKDVDDFRFSHSLSIISRVLGEVDHGRTVVLVHDPYINSNKYTTLPTHLRNRVKVVRDLRRAVLESDVIALLTNHSAYDALADWVCLADGEGGDKGLDRRKYVIDAWGVIRGLRGKSVGNCVYMGLGVRHERV